MTRFIRQLMFATGLAAIGLFSAVSMGAAGLSGSGHDFTTASNTSWNPTGELCLPCHIPHLSSSTTYTKYVTGVGNVDSYGNALGARWNHALSANDANTYTLFVSWATTSTISGTVGVAGVVTESSSVAQTPIKGNVDQNTKLCLGCHDGTVALSSFNVPHGETAGTGGTIPTFAIKGANNDLTATHPIGDAATWKYPTDITKWVDPSWRDAKGIMPLRPMADTGSLAVGCSSCHDPHNTAGNNDFLWVPNNVPGTTVDGRSVNGSLLCENCHIK